MAENFSTRFFDSKDNRNPNGSNNTQHSQNQPGALAGQPQMEGKKSKKVLSKPNRNRSKDRYSFFENQANVAANHAESNNFDTRFMESDSSYKNSVSRLDDLQARKSGQVQYNQENYSVFSDSKLSMGSNNQNFGVNSMTPVNQLSMGASGLEQNMSLLSSNAMFLDQRDVKVDVCNENEHSNLSRRLSKARTALYPTGRGVNLRHGAGNKAMKGKTQGFESNNEYDNNGFRNENFTNGNMGVSNNMSGMMLNGMISGQEADGLAFQKPERQMNRQQDWSMSNENTQFECPKSRRGDMMIDESQEAKGEAYHKQHTLNSKQFSQYTLSTQCSLSQNDRFSELSPFSQMIYKNENSQSGSILTQNSFSSTFSQGKITPKNDVCNENDMRDSRFSSNKKSVGHKIGSIGSQNSGSLQNRSENKTNSTYIYGGDSPARSLQLECEEILGQSMGTASRRKLRQNNISPWSGLDEEEICMNHDMRKIEGIFSNINFSDIIEEKKEPTLEEEIARFNPDSNNVGIDAETIEYLILREREYAPDPAHLERKQREVTSQMRTILIDWLMEVANEFMLKRETVYYAINYIDRFLSEIENIRREEFQLVGITAMHLASKTEEVIPPKMSDFAQAANDCYSLETIRNMELRMLKALKWLLTPPTMNTWVQWYMNQWDLYIETVPAATNHPLVVQYGSLVQFKQANQNSYIIYREMMQLLDCATLNTQSLQYNTRTLVAAFMYLLLGKQFGVFTAQQIYTEMSRGSLYLLNAKNAINTLFGDFLKHCFEYKLPELLPSVQYASTYFGLSMNFDLPRSAKVNQGGVLEGHFEEFLAYQTYHPKAKEFLRVREQFIGSWWGF